MPSCLAGQCGSLSAHSKGRALLYLSILSLLLASTCQASKATKDSERNTQRQRESDEATEGESLKTKSMLSLIISRV